MLQGFDDRNRDLLVNIDGRLEHRDRAGISPFDSAVQGGDAVWEGLRLYDGRIFRLTEHLDRLHASARAMAFGDIPSHDEITRQITRTLEANHMSDGVHIRLTLTRGVKYTSGMDPRLNTAGPTLIVLAEHKPPVYDRAGVRLITSGIRRIPPDCVDQNIHSCNLINSILAKIQANAAGADDALMLDLRGLVAETNATHVFVVRDGTVATPLTTSCPEGITRAVVFELCAGHGVPATARDLSLTEVYAADEMFCSGTMGELVPVTEVDGRTIGGGAPGPVTGRLAAWFAELTARSGTTVVS
ncbi:MAG TPA: aminotransferase class IV [Euzebyales bacterium]|nr:aminotransferase class IV [Euzebyales bacterium]